MTDVTWILGASDPEMSAIEALLRGAGQRVVYAAKSRRRVAPATAYQADGVVEADGGPTELWGQEIVLVECDFGGIADPDDQRPTLAAVCDHHRAGDPGYGRPPAEFLPASSLGQVIALLAKRGALPADWRRLPWMVEAQAAPGTWSPPGTPPGADDPDWWIGLGDEIAQIPQVMVLTAAGDHCPGAAYAGRCPGVDPDALLKHRVVQRAAFQRRPVEAVLADIEATSARIAVAPRLRLGDVDVVDMRPGRGVPCAVHKTGACDGRQSACYADSPELPEAALRLHVAVLGVPRPGAAAAGRQKVTLGGAGEGTVAGTAPVEAFLGGWAAEDGLMDLYGDPARGFAGGYRTGR